MAYIYKQISATSLTDLIAKVKSELINAGWTDVSGAGQTRLKSASDSEGRFAVVDLSTETVATTNYLLLKAATDTALTQNLIQAGSRENDGLAYPLTYTFYANPYWFYVYNAEHYPFGGGLYSPPTGVTAAEQAAPIFLIQSRTPATSTLSNPGINHSNLGWITVDSAGAQIQAGVIGLKAYDTVQSNQYKFSVPNKVLASQAIVAHSNEWFGFLQDAFLVSSPAFALGENVTISGVNHICLRTYNSGFAAYQNFIARV